MTGATKTQNENRRKEKEREEKKGKGGRKGGAGGLSSVKEIPRPAETLQSDDSQNYQE